MSEIDSDATKVEEGIGSLTKADAEDVEEYAASAMDSLLESVNDGFGDRLSSFLGVDNEVDGPSADVIALLAALAVSKLGVVLSVGIDWSAFNDVFGWISNFSFMTIPVPNVSYVVTNTVMGTALLFMQPLCILRMNWLSWEHQHYVPEFPRVLWFIPRFIQVELRTQLVALTPLCWILWILFIITFIPVIAVGDYMSAGMLFLFFGCPAAYFSCVNFYRMKIWQFVNLKFASVVKMRQYENLCMAEGTFLLFLFVAGYPFVINFFISLMTMWDYQNNTDRAFEVIGFMIYTTCPIYYLHRVITDVSNF